jgi:hypothetical protein
MGLEILNLTIAEGKITRKQGGSESAIDFILVNDKARGKVLEVWVDEEKSIDIRSDHNAVIMVYEGDREQVREEQAGTEGEWGWELKGTDWVAFRNGWEEVVWDWGDNDSAEQVEKKIISTVREQAEAGVKMTRKGQGRRRDTRTWWTEELKRAWQVKKNSNREKRRKGNWKKKGGPVTEEELVIAEREAEVASKVFKSMVREAIREDEQRKVKILIGKGEEGGRGWYDFMYGRKKVRTEDLIEEMTVKGIMIKGRENVREKVKEYWEEIGGVGVEEEGGGVGQLVLNPLQAREEQDVNFTEEEIKVMMGKLKSGKAAGPDGIPYEFYREGGRVVWKAAELLFQNFFEEEQVPSSWLESRVTLLHKGGNKNKKDIKNYRPITLTNTIGKTFCNLLNQRMVNLAEGMGILGENQNGFRKDRRGTDNIYILGEIIEGYKGKREKVYLAFLDIEKAYDRVDRETLWKVLRRVGYSEKVVGIIRSLYRETRAKFKIGNIETDWVHSVRGVRQGCILSPLLFSLYTEELAARVRVSGLGLNIDVEGFGRATLGILLYADDIVLIAGDRGNLQRMLDITTEYGRDFKVKFNRAKCGVMIINAEEGSEQETFRLSGMDIERVREYKYLGITLAEDGMERAKREKQNKALQWWGRLASICKFRANRYEVVRGLWKGVAVPSIMYSIEAFGYTKGEGDKLERIQNRVGRLGLGANRFVAVEAIRGEMGWSTFGERMAKSRLNYRVRLEMMDEVRWAKKVFRWGKWKTAWGRDMRRVIREFGTEESIGIGIRRLDRLALGRGILVDRVERNRKMRQIWKGKIDKRVRRVGLEKWRLGIEQKVTLGLYKRKEFPAWDRVYDGSWGAQLLFKVRTGSLELAARTYRWEGNGDLCNSCQEGVRETVEHFVVKCRAYDREREEWWRGIRAEVGNERWEQNRGDVEGFMALILGMDYTEEGRVGEVAKEFLVKAWGRRERIQGQLRQVGVGR